MLATEQQVFLIAEDREDDILLIRKAFEKAGIRNPLQVVRSGEEAMNYLQGVGRYSNRAEYPLPSILLLDLKMPGIDGFEVLRWIRSQLTLSPLRVLILTSSTDIRDVNRAYGMGANSFMVKPMDFENTTELARTINDYWLAKTAEPEISRPEKKQKV